MMKPIWLNKQSFVSLAVEIIVHNSNLYSTLYYFQLFQLETSGFLYITTGTSGISPEMYSSMNDEFIVVIVLFSLYLIVFLLHLSRLVIMLQRNLKVCVLNLKNTMAWFDYLQIVLISFIATIIIMFCILDLGNKGKFALPLTHSVFDDMINYSVSFRNLIRVASVTCMIIIFELVAALKSEFPSFGVLFDTIKYSKNDLINF